MSVEVYIDGIDVSEYVIQGSVSRRLNKVSTATVRAPFGARIDGATGARLKIVIDGTLRFHGMVLTVTDDGSEDTLYTDYVASDPMELWKWRPARDGVASGDPGDFSDPDFFTRLGTGPQIMLEILQQSEDIAQGEDDAEGALYIDYGTFETGGVDLSGAPVDWPMTISEVADLLTSTGEVDIVLDPIDSGGNMATVSCYNGDYGTDRTASVVLDYQTGSYNAIRCRRVEDASNICNKLWYLLAPRIDQQHWRSNITASDSALADPPQTDIETRRFNSQGDYGVRMDIRLFDAVGDAAPSDYRNLYRRLWQMEQWLRSEPRVMVSVTPQRGYLPTFDIGDLISVNAGLIVRGGFSGAQRVYEYTVEWDADGVISISNILASASQEGI